MADLRDAFKKAGMVSDKQIRQAKHDHRVKRKKVGLAGLEAERKEIDEQYKREQDRKRQSDQERASADSEAKVEAESQTVLRRLIKEENILPREGGNKRFYFQLPDGLIPYIEISPTLGKRLSQGDAAIVNSQEILSDDFAVLSGKAAHRLGALEQERILFWNIKR